MVKVSIVMPVYNAEKYLENTIDSVFDQTLDDMEIICVNDGSDDGSLELLNKLAEQYDMIKVFSQENEGCGSARNHGIEESTGEYVAFLDADDRFLDKYALEKMYIYGHQNDADLVCGNLRRIKTDGKIEKKYDFRATRFAYFDKKGVHDPVEYGIPWAFYKNIYKRSLLNDLNIRFPDLKRGQDPIFLANILVNIDEIYVTNADLYGYNHSIGGGVNVKIDTYEKKYDYVKHFKETMDILDKASFESPLAEYKKEFLSYLAFDRNVYDEDLIKIVPEVFGNLNDYFNPDIPGYDYLELLNKSEIEDKYDEYKLIKKCLFEETLISDNFIETDQLREYINYLDEHESDKRELAITSFNELKSIEERVNRKYETLVNKIEELKEIKESQKGVEDVLTSNGKDAKEILNEVRENYNK